MLPTTRHYRALVWAEDVTLVEKPGQEPVLCCLRSRETLLLCSPHPTVIDREMRGALATLTREPLQHP